MSKKIIEKNKLIAEFMGAKMIVGNYHGINIIEFPDKSTKNLFGLKYHSSWDWLMPVVEKINTLSGKSAVNLMGFLGHYSVQLFHHGKITGAEPHGFSKSDSFIDATWTAVVEFIEWYNKNNSNENAGTD